MSIFLRLIQTGDLSNFRIVKAIIESKYEENTVLGGIGTNLLSNRHLIEILKGVEESHRTLRKEILSDKIVKKIRLKGVSRKEKLLMIPESNHNRSLAKRISKTIKWAQIGPNKVEEAVKDSDYNFYILISAIKTGKLSTKTRFESIPKVKGNGKSSHEVSRLVVETNNWGEMSWKDCCLAVKLSEGDNRIAIAVREKKIDLPNMTPSEMLDIIELSGKHGVILDAVREELDRRDKK